MMTAMTAPKTPDGRTGATVIEQTRHCTPQFQDFAEAIPVFPENYPFVRELANIPAVQRLALTPPAASSPAPLVVAR